MSSKASLKAVDEKSLAPTGNRTLYYLFQDKVVIILCLRMYLPNLLPSGLSTKIAYEVPLSPCVLHVLSISCIMI
jgi:hypothetical protein